jgi:diketogulonate reductase-like aldo/keto reductase
MIDKEVILNNKVKMPILGLGVYQAEKGEETQQAVLEALKAGYRHIDTAAIYGNEEDVGIAVKKSGIPREEIFVTTKLWNGDQGVENTEKAFNKSLQLLDMEYVDLYLIHWPVKELRKESWQVLEELYQAGKCRAIGVSNYTIRHLEELSKYAKIVPAVNQVEFSTFLYQKELLEYCHGKGIQLEAYSPLTRTVKLKDKNIIKIAKKYKKSSAQIMLRWAIQHQVIVIPKSVHKKRILENSQLFDFEIQDEDMKFLDSLNENMRLCWDPEKAF